VSELEKNSLEAFQNSIKQGFGIETDVRDSSGKLVISHDVPKGGEIPFEIFLQLEHLEMQLLALNVKSDGIAELIRDELLQSKITNYLVFDMSGPETIAHIRSGNPTLLRVSEWETKINFDHPYSGIWLDSFEDAMWQIDWLHDNLQTEDIVVVVSPELHGREYETLWREIKKQKFHSSPKLALCTDFPEKARLFFGVQDD
jgi:hypothetical protein